MGRNSARRSGYSSAGNGPDAPKQTKADVSRERVVAAAARVFSERGYSGATMRDIADAADLRAGSIYYHYPSKKLLIEAVLEMGIHGVSTAVYSAIAELRPSSTYADRIRTAIEAHLESVLRFGAYASTSRHLLAQVPLEVRRKHVTRRDAYGDFWLKLLESAQTAGEVRRDIDLRLARTFILGALNSTVDWYKPDGKSIEELASQFTAMVEGGILVPGHISSTEDRETAEDDGSPGHAA